MASFNRVFKLLITITLTILLSNIYAETIKVKVFATKDNAALGEVIFEDTKHGLLITPSLTGLPAGPHGFHLHEHPDCADKAMKAGGHYDPAKTNTHLGPYKEGHLGDLPVLIVGNDGSATIPVLAPRLSTKDIKGLALMIHEGADTYSDIPKLGGGAGRLACGIL